MTGGPERGGGRGVLGAVKGDEDTLGLRRVHDQPAAAGYKTTFDPDLPGERPLAMVESRAPDLIVLGATVPDDSDSVEIALRDLRASHPDIPIVLGGPAVGGSLPRERGGMRVLERIDESVQAVEEELAGTTSAASV